MPTTLDAMNISLVDLSAEIVKYIPIQTDTDKAHFKKQGHLAALLCLRLHCGSGAMPCGSFETVIRLPHRDLNL